MSASADSVLERIENMREEIIDQSAAVVRIPSVNPSYPGYSYDDLVGGESDVAHLLGRLCEASGADPRFVTESPGRANLMASFGGSNGGASLAMVGHIDVVPPGPDQRWTVTSPFQPKVVEGRLYGRGTADQKAGLVAQIMAMAALHREGVRLAGEVTVAGVVGEEMMEHRQGITAALEAGLSCDAAIVSEATAPPHSLGVAPITPGLLWFSLTVTGKPSHTSLRGMSIYGVDGDRYSVNAIEKMLGVMEGLRQLERRWFDEKTHPLFPEGHFTIMPGVIRGGPDDALVPFITPNWCTVEYTVWYNPDDDPEAVKKQIANVVSEVAANDTWLSRNPPVFDWRLCWPPSSTPADAPVVRTVRDAHRDANGQAPNDRETGGEVQGYLAMCDGSFLTAAGIPSVVYGPGSMAQAHQANEFVRIDELIAATRTYALTALRWCGES